MQRSLFIQRDITCSREGKQAAPYVQDGRHTFSAGNCNALFVYNLKRPIQEALRNSHNTNSKCRSEKFHTRCERARGSNILIIASPNAEKYKIIKRIVQRRMVWADESFCFRGSDARRSPSGSLGPSWGPLGAVLGASWAVMGPSWRPLGRSWRPLGTSAITGKRSPHSPKGTRVALGGGSRPGGGKTASPLIFPLASGERGSPSPFSIRSACG